MKNKTYTAITVLIVFGLGLALGYFILKKPANKTDTKQLERKNEQLQEEVKTHRDSLRALHEANVELNSHITADSVERSLERRKTIPVQATLTNEATILAEGGKLYGLPGVENNKRALVASYGAQAVEHVDLLIKINRNKKVETLHYEGITRVQDTIIQNTTLICKQYKREGRGKLVKGVGIGAVLTALGFLLL